MAKKKTKNQPKKKQVNAENVIGLHSEVTDQPITQTLEVNYMPYAMSVNVSRAFPEIDGFKPSHRKLLYTMYKMGLLKGERQKSANIVGQTMKLNPHGDRRDLRDDGASGHRQRGTARPLRGVEGQLWQVLFGRPELRRLALYRGQALPPSAPRSLRTSTRTRSTSLTATTAP